MELGCCFIMVLDRGLLLAFIIIIVMGKQVISEEKKMFLETIKDIRKLVSQDRGSYSKDTMGLNRTNTKVPFTHLLGRRNKLKSRHHQ